MRCCCLLLLLVAAAIEGGDGGVTGRRIEDGLAAGDTGDLGDFEAFNDDGESDADFGDECAAIDTMGTLFAFEFEFAFAIARSCAGEAVADSAYLLGDGFIDADVDDDDEEEEEAEDEEIATIEKSEETNESADDACARPAENG